VLKWISDYVIKWLIEFEYMNLCLDVDAMIMYMNWKVNCCWWWIHMPKIIYVGMLCFSVKLMNWWGCGCWIMSEFMIICCWWCFETCCWWIGVMSMLIGELMMKVVVVVEYLWKFGKLLNFDKMMF